MKKQASIESKNHLTPDEIRDFIDNASLSLHCVDGNGIIAWANDTELKTLGYEKDEYIGRSIVDFHYDADVIDDILQRLGRFETLQNYPARMVCKDGSLVDVLINSNVYKKEGEFVHTRCFTRDVTELKKTETELIKTNEQLEQFTFMACHDLQEPLRTLTTCCELLQETLGDEVSKKHNLEFSQIIESAARMREMIKAILRYAETGHADESSEVHVNDCVIQATSLLKASITESKANITYDKLPTISGNPALLAQLFQNLIENAIKFNKNQPEVKITAEKVNNEWVFSVSDNGIGIDVKHQEKVFKPFKRLHNTKEFKGVGIGLAACQKIVDLHGGRIWVESDATTGSTFHFTLAGKDKLSVKETA